MLGPDEYDLKDIQHYIGSAKMGTAALEGDESFVWGSARGAKTNALDLVTLKPRENQDTFSRWIAERALLLIRIFGRCIRPSTKHGAVVIYDSVIMRVTFWITSIIASMIPIASIVVLLHLNSRAARLGAIAGFNVLITVCLSLFTEARRTDCFAVTAAYVYPARKRRIADEAQIHSCSDRFVVHGRGQRQSRGKGNGNGNGGGELYMCCDVLRRCMLSLARDSTS